MEPTLSFGRSDLEKRYQSAELLAELWEQLIPADWVPETWQFCGWLEHYPAHAIERCIRQTARKYSKVLASGEVMTPSWLVRYCQKCLSTYLQEHSD